MSVYAGAIATAKRLIARFGAVATIRRTTGPGVVVNSTVSAVLANREKHYLGDSQVEIGDWKMILDSAFAPMIGDTVEIGSDRYSIQRVEPVQPGGTPVLWYAWARAA